MISLFGRLLVPVLLFCDIFCGVASTYKSKESSIDVNDWSLDVKVDEDSRFKHTMNVYIISFGISLFFFITITSFILKNQKTFLLPDATSSLLYGIIIGIIMRYGRSDDVKLEHGFNMDNLSTSHPPQYLLNSFLKHNYIYKLQGATKKIPKESYMTRNVLIFDSEIFFYLILPPIMFVAGLRMNKVAGHFVKNFNTLLIISIIGSFGTAMIFSGAAYMYAAISHLRTNKTLLTGSECMLFGAIVSPTDPMSIFNVFTKLKVEPTLNSIVFGESALNDIVSLVLYDAVEGYAIMYQKSNNNSKYTQIFKPIGRFLGVLLGSVSIGILVGAVGSFITKTSTIYQYSLLETAFYITISYSSYLIGEMLHCAGLVSILFCGMFNSHYTNYNLSYDSLKFIEQAYCHLKCIFDFFEFLAANFVFFYIGVSLFGFAKHEWNAGFTIWSLICLLFARAVVVYGFCYLLNLVRRDRLPVNSQHVLFFAGLKGAVSFALANRNAITQSRQIMLTTTMTLVVVTVLIFGSLFSIIKKIFNVPVNVPVDLTPEDPSNELYDNDYNESRYSSHSKFMKKWHEYDMKIFIPFFTKSGPPLMVQLKNLCSSIKKFFCCSTKGRHDSSSDNEFNLSAHDTIKEGYSEMGMSNQETIDHDDIEFNEVASSTHES